MAENLAGGDDWRRRRGNRSPKIQMSTGYRKGTGDEQANLPKGDPRIAPCFNMGYECQNEKSPEGTAESASFVGTRSAVPPGIIGDCTSIPNLERLGYSHLSLRDAQANLSGTGQESRRSGLQVSRPS